MKVKCYDVLQDTHRYIIDYQVTEDNSSNRVSDFGSIALSTKKYISCIN